MRKELTPRQRQVLDFLRQFSDANQRPPTHREICAHLGTTSTNGVAEHLQRLEKWGWIVRDARLARGIRFTDDDGPVQKRVGLEKGGAHRFT